MAKTEALLMDADGTLLNTTSYIAGGFRAAYSKLYGIDISEAVMLLLAGRPLKECYRILAGVYGLDFTEHSLEICTRLHREFQEDNLSTVKAFPGAGEMVDQVRTGGRKTAVVTARTGAAKKLLEITGLLKLMDTVVTGDDVTRHKPDPEGILIATGNLGLKPDVSIMMGDTYPDIEAGRRAGVKGTIGVTWGMEGERIRKANPDYVISHMAQALWIVLGEDIGEHF